MTADLESSEEPDSGSREDDPGARAVATNLITALVFLLVAVVLGLIAAMQLVLPDMVSGIPFLSYGRLVPMVTSALLYGWLTLGLLAGAYYVLPRLSMHRLRGVLLAYFSAAAITVGVVVGIIGIGLGQSEGRLYLEMPLYADAFVWVGLLLAAAVVTRNVAPSRQSMVPSHWYLLASSWLAVLTYLVGNFPGLAGFTGAMQTGFFRAAMTGFWFVAAGVGLIYYLIPRIVGTDPMRPSPLSALGFWSLALVWGTTGPVMYIYGPGPGWYETLGVAFAIALFVPVLIIVADFFVAMRGQWERVDDRGALSFVLVGALLFLLIPVQTLVQALRTSSAVVQFTEFVPAGDALVYLGALSLWLFALAYSVKGPGVAGSPLAIWHLRLSLVGLFLMLGAMWMGGVATGFTWAAGANSQSFTSFGEGWIEVDRALDPYLMLRAFGAGIYAFAQVLLIITLLRRRKGDAQRAHLDASPLDLQIAGEPGAPGWAGVRFGAVVLFIGALLLTVVLPALDPSVEDGTILADADRVYPAGSTLEAGRAVYLEEGCYYCHTQQVRPVVTDVGLGPVSVAGDYVHETPALLGFERLGADLMHFGSRATGAGELRQTLVDPRGRRQWSLMPSYDYLSDEELDALVEYLLSLR